MESNRSLFSTRVWRLSILNISSLIKYPGPLKHTWHSTLLELQQLRGDPAVSHPIALKNPFKRIFPGTFQWIKQSSINTTSLWDPWYGWVLVTYSHWIVAYCMYGHLYYSVQNFVFSLQYQLAVNTWARNVNLRP